MVRFWCQGRVWELEDGLTVEKFNLEKGGQRPIPRHVFWSVACTFVSGIPRYSNIEQPSNLTPDFAAFPKVRMNRGCGEARQQHRKRAQLVS